mmetsp:Transcript_658/g.1201  ORF Transcript_658/g.1201 Transcript_658/m.1201 type:complete len:103 (+) Transcript_658:203-511(+)
MFHLHNVPIERDAIVDCRCCHLPSLTRQHIAICQQQLLMSLGCLFASPTSTTREVMCMASSMQLLLLLSIGAWPCARATARRTAHAGTTAVLGVVSGTVRFR